MTAIVKSVGEFLTLLVQAFNLSSIFPALVLVLLLRLFALPILPEPLVPPVKYAIDTLSEGGALALFTVLLAYLLDAANMQIIRLFEGYHFIDQFPFYSLRKYHQTHVEETIEQVEYSEKWITDLIKQAEKEPDEDKKSNMVLLAFRLADYRSKLLGRFQNKYPKDPEYVMPTSFGNVIAASEQYPHEAFGMDAVTLWPFLRPILTKRQYAQFLVREKAIMDFLVNLTLVLVIFGLVFSFSLWFTGSLSWIAVIQLSAIAFGCWLSFHLAVQGAASWGATVRTAFVVFREDLRKQLRVRQATDYEDERKLWQSVSQFMRVESHEDQQIELGKMIFDNSSYLVK